MLPTYRDSHQRCAEEIFDTWYDMSRRVVSGQIPSDTHDRVSGTPRRYACPSASPGDRGAIAGMSAVPQGSAQERRTLRLFFTKLRVRSEFARVGRSSNGMCSTRCAFATVSLSQLNILREYHPAFCSLLGPSAERGAVTRGVNIGRRTAAPVRIKSLIQMKTPSSASAGRRVVVARGTTSRYT